MPPNSQPEWYGYGHSLIINYRGKVLARVDSDIDEQIVYAELPIPPYPKDAFFKALKVLALLIAAICGGGFVWLLIKKSRAFRSPTI